MASPLIPLISAGVGALGQGLSAIGQNNATQQQQQEFEEQLQLQQAAQAQAFAQQNAGTNQANANNTALSPGRLSLLKALYAKAGVPVPASMTTNPVAQSTDSAAMSQLKSYAARIQAAQTELDAAKKAGPRSGQSLPDFAGYLQSIQKAIDTDKQAAQTLSGQVGQGHPATPPAPTPSGVNPSAPPSAPTPPPAVQPTQPATGPSLAMAPASPTLQGPGSGAPGSGSMNADPTVAQQEMQRQRLRAAMMAKVGAGGPSNTPLGDAGPMKPAGWQTGGY